jgi:hypothetical protein
MNVSQPHHRNVPEEEDENEKNETGKDEQSDEDSFLRLNLQRHPLVISSNKIGRTNKDQSNLNKFWVRLPQKFVSTFPLIRLHRRPQVLSVDEYVSLG